MSSNRQQTLGILGLGKMGEALVSGLKSGRAGFALLGSTRTPQSAKEASKRLGIACGANNLSLVKKSSVVVLCVKPQHAMQAVKSAAKGFTKNHLLISICASVRTEDLIKWTGGRCAVIRAMPNTPCLIGEGMTVLAPGKSARDEHTALAEKIFGTVGKTAVADESLMDGVTGLGGCGPAYIYLIIEALSEAGVKVGLARKTATLIAAQTLLGAAKMVLERGVHPAALKDEVTTPAGCTIDGLMALEEGKLRATLIRAVLAATERSRGLRD